MQEWKQEKKKKRKKKIQTWRDERKKRMQVHARGCLCSLIRVPLDVLCLTVTRCYEVDCVHLRRKESSINWSLDPQEKILYQRAMGLLLSVVHLMIKRMDLHLVSFINGTQAEYLHMNSWMLTQTSWAVKEVKRKRQRDRVYISLLSSPLTAHDWSFPLFFSLSLSLHPSSCSSCNCPLSLFSSPLTRYTCNHN